MLEVAVSILIIVFLSIAVFTLEANDKFPKYKKTKNQETKKPKDQDYGP